MRRVQQKGQRVIPGRKNMDETPATQMRQEIKELALDAKGFLSEAEGLKLFELATEGSLLSPCLEIGSYCGRSAIFLAEGCRVSGRHVLFTIDHHRGSEEQQPGEEYYDPELFDSGQQSVFTLNYFVKNIRRAGLEDWVIPVVARSSRLAAFWPEMKLGLLFIDGGHSAADVQADFENWGKRVVSGGYLCLHDIFPNPDDGGQAPFRIFEHARKMDEWENIGIFESLGVLRRCP